MLVHMPEVAGQDEYVVSMFKINLKSHAVHLVPGLRSSARLLMWQVCDLLPLEFWTPRLKVF